jgi:SnoaL-like protein
MTDQTSELAELRHELDLLKDAAAIRHLQHSYGYFMDKGLYQEVVDLFAEDGELHFMGGVFKGRAGVARLYCGRLREGFTDGINGPVYGMLCDHIQLQEVIHVADDRTSARARFRALLQGGMHITKPIQNPRLPQQWWEGGLYENDYVREDGVWKIKRLGHHLTWQGDFRDGWSHWPVQEGPFWKTLYPDDPLGPDEIQADAEKPWPNTSLVPFHYDHPVTGKPIEAQKPR